MIFGSKALSLAVLGALILSDEASAAKLKKGNQDNKGLRKTDRKLKSSKGEGKVSKDVGGHIFFQVCDSFSMFVLLTPRVDSQIFVFVYFH